MEDEDMKCVTKIDAVSVVENKSPCVPVCKEINKIIPAENNAINSSEGELNDKNLVFKLKSVSNQENINTCLETENNLCSESTDPTDESPKKVNGEIDKNESKSIAYKEDLDDGFGKANEAIEDVTTEAILVSEVEHTNKRKHPSTDTSDEFNPSDDESENKSSSESSPVEFRGFKKRKILEAEKEKTNSGENVKQDEDEKSVVYEPIKPKVELRRSARNANLAKKKSNEQPVEHKEENGDQLTEYAQYLGLQPTVKFKCGRCGEKHFQSMASLNAHQKICSNSGSNSLVKPAKPPGDSNLSTNFRITRKVYLCSACGTYYENWKLFLHMRDMHKRHICLFCLGMFSVADKLAEHLLCKHNVHEKTCKSPEEFLNLFKGSCYLTCCSCEKMFTEREDFFDHQCKDSLSGTSVLIKDSPALTSKDVTERCNLCGIKFGHFQSCPNVHNKFPSIPMPSTSVNNKSTTTPPANMSLTKFYIPVPASVQKEWNNTNALKSVNTRPICTSDKDDYYDVGSAASFCHVDIANDSDTQKPSDNKLNTDVRNSERKTYSRQDSRRKSPVVSVDNTESSVKEGSSTNTVSNEISSSSDESVPEKIENSPLKADESCDSGSSSHQKDKQIDDGDGEKDSKMNDDGSDADEQDSSEGCANEIEKSVENTDVDKRSCEIVSVDKKEYSYLKNSPIIPCYIKLNRLEEKPVENETNKSSSEMEVEDNLNNEVVDKIPDVCSDVADKVSSNDMSSSNKNNNSNKDNINDGSSTNLETISSLNNESVTLENSEALESSKTQEKSSDHIPNDRPCAEIDNMNSDDNRSNNNTSPLLVENGFESKESTDLLDKSDESEDSDKLSVVLSEEGFENDEENKTKNDLSGVEQNDTNFGMNSNYENTNCTENETSRQTDASNDSNIMHNGNETTDESNNIESQNNNNNLSKSKEDNFKIDGEKIQLASEEVMAMALTLEDRMDALTSQSVVKECVRTSCTTCSYCSHAVKIGVNGKQLALHLLAEHRYMPVKNETVEDVIDRLKKSLEELQDIWFNTDSYDSSDKSCFVPYDHTYDCFQCNYVTNLHKDLYIHHRKVHQKSILYCCMCKANFHSYSELLCHMCPGLYVSKDIQFRCCLCPLDKIPSAFRLMVHLRKSHHTCDICLEIAGDQQKLSTHMWKHKLNHLCYRCGISYRNKPDITKHLFWKHGTESVLCKKCLQKKWPHVYHFCIPPTVFICEECNVSFTKAVALKVHKRMHAGDFPYPCTSCEQKFVSKKLLLKHEKSHNEVSNDVNSKTEVLTAPEEMQKNADPDSNKLNDASVHPQESKDDVPPESEKSDEIPVKQHKKKSKKDKEKKLKPVVDVYDLPPLNLSSESDDSDDEKEVKSAPVNSEESQDKKEKESKLLESNKDGSTVTEDAMSCGVTEEDNRKQKINDAGSTAEPGPDTEENAQPVTVVDGIWDSFHSYRAEQEKRENLDVNNKHSESQVDARSPVIPKEALLGDHDYCIPTIIDTSVDENAGSEKPTTREHSSSIDHDYCTLNNADSGSLSMAANQDKMVTDTPSKKKQKSPKKKVLKQHNSSSSSDSSSDSDSSSCSCGTNCSCTSSSSNSSSSSSTDSDSSSSEGRRHNSSVSKREKKRERLKNKRKEDVTKPVEPSSATAAEEEPVVDLPVEPEEPLIKESDLDTDETSTDEEFYDQNPQRHANQMLAEKRNQSLILGAVTPVNNGTASPIVPSKTEPPLTPLSDSVKIDVTPPSTPVPAIITTAQPQNKKKVKSKKRKKSSQLVDHFAAEPQNVLYETSQPSTSFSANHGKQMITDSPYTVSTPVMTSVPNQNLVDNNMFLSNQSQSQPPKSSESHSSKRLSKRRRVRNKFYGYSSEEEDEKHQTHPHQLPPSKWKKTATDVSAQHHIKQQQPQQFHHLQAQQQLHMQQQFQATQPPMVPEYNFPPKMVQLPVRAVDDHKSVSINDRLNKRPSTSRSSSSSEMNSESDSERTVVNPVNPNPASAVTVTEKDDKLYCYCQCPYDEVSEMIACDGVDCAIEWFHFECVGIMVPPKGKWYCPDCRKRRGLS